jgi:purine-binding chemotaxis protein CheW
MNLRGQIVPAIDLRKRLELPPRPADKEPMYTVAYTNEGAVALIVDEIGDVIEVPAEMSSAPETLHPATRGILNGIYKLPRALLLMVNIERVLVP